MSQIDPSRWTRRAALAASTAAVATPAYAQLGGLFGNSNQNQTPPANAQAPQGAGVQGTVPLGYSKDFLPVREMIVAGQYDEALKAFEPPPPDSHAKSTAIVDDPFLMNAEGGLIELENGAPDLAQARFRAADDSATGKAAKDKESVGDNVSSGLGWMLGKVTGQEAKFEAYHALDHERILQLNYMTLSFFLQGDRRCYNVTRSCIEEQTQLKAKFDKEIAEYKAKYAQQTAAKDQNQNQNAAANNSASVNGLSDQFKAYDDYANRVPNAYVNPLADYLAGVIQEVVGSEQPALRDNSRIAYLDAAKLCGGAPQLLSAAQAMARPRVPAKERVLHVVVAEGFAPAREVLTFGFVMNGAVIPVRIPIFKPIPSAVARIAVRSDKGKVFGECDPIGDFEAIRLRDQHDRMPEIMLSVLSSVLTSYGVAQATQNAGLFGVLVRTVRETTAEPDTRSWLSLPRRFHVARVTLPAGAQTVELVAYDGTNREIVSSTAQLTEGETQSFLYARATDSALRLQATRRLWIDGRLEG